jgi:hypothetical protein
MFRIWFHAIKLFPLALAMMAGGFFLPPPWGAWLASIGMWMAIGLGVTGALLGVAVFAFGWRWRCPLCGRRGDLFSYERRMALACDDCGIVHGGLFNLRLRVEPNEGDEEQGFADDDEDDEEEKEDAWAPYHARERRGRRIVGIVVGILLTLLASGVIAEVMGHDRVVGVLFGVAFIMVGLCMNAIMIVAWMKSIRLRSWPVAKGLVLSSQIVEYPSERNSLFGPEIVYQYHVDGRRYRSNRIGIFEPARWFRKTRGMLRLIERYPVGATIDVHYPPGDPVGARLQSGVGFSACVLTVFALLLLAPLLVPLFDWLLRAL